MGLKYNFFVVEADPDELLKNLVAGGATDKTPLMLAEREWGRQQLADMMAVRAMTATPEEKTDKIMKALDRPRTPPELAQYHKETVGPEFHGMEIWWMRFPPNPKYIIGGYTSYMFQRSFFMTIAAHYLTKFGKLKDIWFINFHHGSNEGDIIKILSDPAAEHNDNWVTNFPSLPEEEERYEIYAARISRGHGAPAKEVHDWINDDETEDPVQWTHTVRFQKRSDMDGTDTQKLPGMQTANESDRRPRPARRARGRSCAGARRMRRAREPDGTDRRALGAEVKRKH